MEWKSFLLRPRNKTHEEQLADQGRFVDYTQSWLRPAALEARAVFRPWRTDSLGPSGSLGPQAAAKVMDGFAPRSADAYHWRLLEAYFSENRTISDPEVLADLAAEIGEDRGAFAAALRQGWKEAASQVTAEHDEALAMGITAVPTMLLDGTLLIAGAQDVDSYVIWVERLLARR